MLETGVKKSHLKYLALGDSYTIGEGVAESERWPNQLVQQLSILGLNFEPISIIAQTGWTTQNLLSAIQGKHIDETFDLVSLLIGVNNQYQGKEIEDYACDFEKLLEIAIRMSGGNKGKVFVLSIPDYSVTPFATKKDTQKIANEIRAFNKVNKQIAEGKGVKYFDITQLSRKAKTDTSFLAEDGLHPSAKMYTEWTEIIYPEIANLLQ